MIRIQETEFTAGWSPRGHQALVFSRGSILVTERLSDFIYRVAEWRGGTPGPERGRPSGNAPAQSESAPSFTR